MNYPDEPTPEQCTARAEVAPFDGRRAFACWYPQMGGYVGKAVVLPSVGHDGRDGCFEVYVWHDGEFPFFDGEERTWDFAPPSPAHLHHCAAEQFVRFGQEVSGFTAKLRVPPSHKVLTVIDARGPWKRDHSGRFLVDGRWRHAVPVALDDHEWPGTEGQIIIYEREDDPADA